METDYQSDEYWIKRMATDINAFEVIYDRYLPGLSRYIYRRIGDPIETEELTAEVFFHAVEGIINEKYSSRNQFAAWLFSIARVKIANFFRNRKIDSDIDTYEELSIPTNIESTTPVNINLEKCFRDLTDSDKELLALRFSADLDFNTIASILHKNSAAVKMATYRALRKLRQEMEKLNEQDANE